jgi:acyl-CoA thioesterase FadM
VKKKVLALIAVLSVATVTACGQVNSAATLGDITITQSSFQATVDELLKERESVDQSQMQLEVGSALNRSQLRFMVITTIFDEIAKELKISVSKTEEATTRQTLVDQSGGEEALSQNLVAAQIAPSNFERYIRAIVITEKLADALEASGVSADAVDFRITELVNAKAKELKVTINPRYGTWDYDAGDILATDSAGDAIAPSQPTE